MEQILVVGYFGAGNVGDEAILEAIAQEFRRRRPGIRIMATQAGDRWGAGADIPPVSLLDVDALSAAVSESSAVLFGCGGVFQDYWGAYESSLFKERTNGIEAYVRPALLARLRDVPAVLFSAGIGPLRTPAGRQLVALGCSGVALASVRDQASRTTLESTGVGFSPVVSADPAYLLEVPEGVRASVRARLAAAGLAAGSYLLVAIRSWPFEPFAVDLGEKIAAGLRALPGDVPLLVVPFHATGRDDDDVSFARHVRDAAGRGHLFEGAGVHEALALSEEARLVLAGRNHAAIFAHVSGTPFVALAYDPKVAEVARAAGTEHLALGLDQIDHLSSRLRLALDTEAALRARLEGTIGAVRDRAALPFEMVGGLLDARREARSREAATGLESVAAALQAERVERLRLEELSASLERDRTMLESEHAALESERAELATRLEEREAERESLLRERHQDREAIAYFSGREEALRRELASIHGSRLWKVGMTWWRFLDLLRGLRGGPRARQDPSLAPPPRPAAAEAPGAIRARAAEAAPAFRSGRPEGNRHDVVCLPIIDWDFRFQRPQQLMKRFGAAGHRVFYVAQAFRSEGPSYALSEKARNVWEVSLKGPPRNVYKDALSEAEAGELLTSLDELRRGEGLGATVSVVQLPFWWPVAQRARERLSWPVVYDCMDFHAGFSTNDPAMLEREEALLAGASVVVVSSLFLEKEARKRSSRVTRVPNACDYEHFAGVPDRPAGRPPVIGYYGAIADWFDSDLVADLAERRPDWTLLLVGSTFTADLSRLSKLPNVRLAGEVPYADLPSWLAKMDVCLLPFKRIPLTEATNPVKVYEILAAGRPLVSVPLPEVVALGDLVRTAEDAGGFEKEIEAALEETAASVIEKRRAFARGQTWERRLEALEAAVRSAFPMASVVVVTYNNLAWNRICLESLYERTEWPNLEVIVVDNASADGTREFLREAEGRWPGLRVILNESNEGFARANNRGLRAAAGEILVLLNNDTAVSRGWLSALSRHLLADRRIGLIGPVTNETGNEARVPVGYGDLAAMPAWAARFTAINDGQLLSMPSLAMFCLAMRRDVWERLGPLDERFGTGMFEDDDYALRARELGLLTLCTGDAFVHHAGRASFRQLRDEAYQELFDGNRDLFEAKWGAWHPHLSREQRAEAARFIEELRRQRMAVGGQTARTLLVLHAGRDQAAAEHLSAVARAAASKGWFVVLDRSGSRDSALASLRSDDKRVWSYTGAEDLLPELEPDVVWATPVSAVSARLFDPRKVVYDVSTGLPEARDATLPLARAQERLLVEAAEVVARPKDGVVPTESSARLTVIAEGELAERIPRLIKRLSEESSKADAVRPSRKAGGSPVARATPERGGAPPSALWESRFQYQGSHEPGFCIVCGGETLFTFSSPSLHRESLVCRSCGATSRYRAIARGLLRFLRDRVSVESRSLADLAAASVAAPVRIYDTQVPFAYASCAYPLPEILGQVPWIRVRTSVFRPSRPSGEIVGPGVTNENLERLSFEDSSLDVVIASDVLEHVRRDDLALREVHRVLSSGGAFLFTVPHIRTMRETVVRRLVVDPEDSSKDVNILPPEYHGDANSDTGSGALAYRVYGTDLDEQLEALGFDVRYVREDDPGLGIRNAELFACIRRG